MKKKMLFVSMHLPSLNVPEAGQKISYNKLKEYANIYDVKLVSLFNEMESKFYNDGEFLFCSSINLFKITNYHRIINLIGNLYLPYYYAIRNDRRIKKIICEFIKNNPDGIVHIEYENGLYLIPKQCKLEKRIVLHDVISQSILRFIEGEKSFFKKIALIFLYRWVCKSEKNKLKKFEQVIVLNEKDKNLLSGLGVNENVKLEYPQINEMFYKIQREIYDKNKIMFWGAMNRFENIDAVKWFCSSIFPHVLNEIPDVKFYIVGANPPDEILRLASNNIIVTGFVNDPKIYFENCFISVVPLRYGAGIKIKVLEAMAAGMTIVTTTVGAEGVVDDAQKLHINDDEVSIANEIIKLISSEK